MPIGENVLSIPVITSSVKAVRGMRAVCGVMGPFKVVFRRVLQNTTRLGVVQVVEPLIKRVPACFVAKYNTVAYRNTFFSVAGYIFSISDKAWFYRCPMPVLHR